MYDQDHGTPLRLCVYQHGKYNWQEKTLIWHMWNRVSNQAHSTLQQTPLHMASLFPDSLPKRSEEDIAQYESKVQSSSSSHKKGCCQPYEGTDISSQQQI